MVGENAQKKIDDQGLGVKKNGGSPANFKYCAAKNSEKKRKRMGETMWLDR